MVIFCLSTPSPSCSTCWPTPRTPRSCCSRERCAFSPPPLAAVLHRTESIGFEVTHGYGLTEMAVLVVRCAWKREWNKLPTLERAWLKARQGVHTPGMAEVDIVDGETGRSVPRDGSTMGEIVLRGGLRHARLPQRREGHQGVIISGGENISNVEVESMLYNHPA